MHNQTTTISKAELIKRMNEREQSYPANVRNHYTFGEPSLAIRACKAVVQWSKDANLYGTSNEPACVDMCEAAINESK